MNCWSTICTRPTRGVSRRLLYSTGKAYLPERDVGARVWTAGQLYARDRHGESAEDYYTQRVKLIFLNEKSAPVYGLLVNYMHATDTGSQQETMILNGYSFNFITSDGDVLTGKFRAFKFPDSTYVQFKGTVTVCLDKCQGVQCSNGVTGYEDVLALLKNLKIANQRLGDHDGTPASVAETMGNKLIPHNVESKASYLTCSALLLGAVFVLLNL
ncbi:Quasimodo-like protein [Operophtera brumata]|uniref:Quasimodo-like protein n=1 Tax=Operophtera brumata TaxID=104452 RepID=A0A0L7L8U0_OPEBR|nr:Quasimodo-like protein [Operophtera brumata]